uniref:FAF domain-containing protein n=1 Tax=Solanum tuberosum TaxID=4113 RepID=M1CMR7_SOLTU
MEKSKSVCSVDGGVELKFDSKLGTYGWFSCTSGGGEGVFGLRKEKKKVKIEREYPPPIPGLAKTENVPSSQMPWVMKRYHTSDGRLIIKEEKVKRFEYFETHRTEGRLMLNLIPLNDNVGDSDDDDDAADGGDVVEKDGCDQGEIDRTAPEESESALVNGGGGGGGGAVIGGGGSGGVKCSSLCTFGVAAPAIRPVHT